LLESACLEDNIVAILARLSDEILAVKRILGSIAQNHPAHRAQAIKELMILAGLRNLSAVVEKEIERMPILNDIMDHPVIGRERKLGMAMGERNLVLIQIGTRFGPVPAWAAERIESLAVPELEKLAVRLLHAPTIEDLFG